MGFGYAKSIFAALAFATALLAAAPAEAVIAIIAPDPVGIVSGQTVRLTVLNRGLGRGAERGFVINWRFLDAAGRVLKQASQCVSIGAGEMMWFDLPYIELGAHTGDRVQLRAEVIALGGPDTRVNLGGSVEVIDDATGQTTVFIWNPGDRIGFNPQPDPPGNPCGGG